MTAAGVETTTLPPALIPVDDEKAAEEKFANERFKILPREVSSFYDGASRLPTLQRMLSRQLEASSLNIFLNSPVSARTHSAFSPAGPRALASGCPHAPPTSNEGLCRPRGHAPTDGPPPTRTNSSTLRHVQA